LSAGDSRRNHRRFGHDYGQFRSGPGGGTGGCPQCSRKNTIKWPDGKSYRTPKTGLDFRGRFLLNSPTTQYLQREQMARAWTLTLFRPLRFLQENTMRIMKL